MADTRELILKRMAAIAAEQAGFVTVVRNRGLRDNEKRPAIVLLDGDETAVLTHGGRSNRAGSGRTYPMTPQIMRMVPELYVIMDETKPGGKVRTEEELGPAVNAKRVQLVKAIAEDDQLLALVGSNGNILLSGTTTDFKSGAAMSGQMRLDFAITYTFFPTTNSQGVS